MLPEQKHKGGGNKKLFSLFFFFFNKNKGAAPCTENRIYFPLLLLYVKSGQFQSSELLQSLFVSGGLSRILFFCVCSHTNTSSFICLLPCGFLSFSYTPFPDVGFAFLRSKLHFSLRAVLFFSRSNSRHFVSLSNDGSFSDAEYTVYSCANNFIMLLSYV